MTAYLLPFSFPTLCALFPPFSPGNRRAVCIQMSVGTPLSGLSPVSARPRRVGPPLLPLSHQDFPSTARITNIDSSPDLHGMARLPTEVRPSHGTLEGSFQLGLPHTRARLPVALGAFPFTGIAPQLRVDPLFCRRAERMCSMRQHFHIVRPFSHFDGLESFYL